MSKSSILFIYFIYHRVDFLSGYPLAARFRQENPQILVHFLHGLQLIRAQGNHRAFSPVNLHKALLPQRMVGLVHRVHVNADLVSQCPDRGQCVSLLISGGCNSENNLVPELKINRFLTVEIYLYNHRYPFTCNCNKRNSPAIPLFFCTINLYRPCLKIQTQTRRPQEGNSVSSWVPVF